MPEKKELTDFYINLSKEIQLSDTAIEIIERTFNTIKSLIENNIENDIEFITFPQGSCSLGTTIKPLGGSDEDFDVDLIVAIKNKDMNAFTLKKTIGDILLNSSKYKDKVQEKGRAWCINYSMSHIDIVPALVKSDNSLEITNKMDDGTYIYMKSNPQGLTEWFKKMCWGNEYSFTNTLKTKPLHLYSSHSVLQKVVQILKYHRNVFCDGLPEKTRPISMLITVISAELYNNEKNIFDALKNITSKIPEYLEEHKDHNGKYKIYNPVDKSEVFTDKWIEHPERKNKFEEWATSVYKDLVYNAISDNRVAYTRRLKPIFGEFVSRSYYDIGQYYQHNQLVGKMSYTESDGITFGENDDKNSFSRNTFWGK